MGYSIKVLNNEDFENLPYERVSTSLGVADPKKNTAYIRYSAYPDLNNYLIHHEFEHLIEDSTEEQEGSQGERYKDFGNTFGDLASFAAPLIGTAVGGPAGGAVGSLVGGGIKGGSSGQGFLKGATNSIPSAATNFIGGGTAQAAPDPTSGFASSFTNNFLSPQQLTQQRAMIPGGYNPGSSPSTGGSGGGIFDMFKGALKGDGLNNILGLGSLATGLLKPFPKVPALPPSVDQARSQIQAGGSPLGQFSQGKLQELMNQNYDPLSQPEIDASLRQLELEQKKAEDQVRDTYRNLRPGTDPSSDSAFRRDLAEVQDQFSRAKADTVATRTRDTKTAFDNQRLSQIQTSLGASSQDMQQLIQLAQMDINQIAAQLDLDVQQAKLFKETFINLGSSLLTPPSAFDQFLASQTAA